MCYRFKQEKIFNFVKVFFFTFSTKFLKNFAKCGFQQNFSIFLSKPYVLGFMQEKKIK